MRGARSRPLSLELCDATRRTISVKTVASKVKPALNRVSSVVRRGCGNSFVAGTLVTLADGSQVPIEDVAVGDVVLSTDPATGVTGPGVVTDVIRHQQVHAWVAVQVVTDAGVQTLDATAEHPFFVVSPAGVMVPADAGVAGFWIDAADLVVGDVVSTADGGTGIVSTVTVSGGVFEGDTWAYNLTIADTHTYYVGDEPVLVHNTTCRLSYERVLDGGSRVRTYGPFKAARTPGEMAGARTVREVNTVTGRSRVWYETYDHVGRVRIVHPKKPAGPHYVFGRNGGYRGNF